MRLHPSRQARLVETLKRSAVAGRPGGRAFEDIFQIVVVVAIQSANRQSLLGAFQLPTLEAVFAASVGPQGQADVRPQLPLGAKAMRRLQQGHQ